MTFKMGRTIKRGAAAIVAAVVVATVLVAGGALATHSTAPAEASAIHIAATQEPVPASNAQPVAGNETSTDSGWQLSCWSIPRWPFFQCHEFWTP